MGDVRDANRPKEEWSAKEWGDFGFRLFSKVDRMEKDGVEVWKRVNGLREDLKETVREAVCREPAGRARRDLRQWCLEFAVQGLPEPCLDPRPNLVRAQLVYEWIVKGAGADLGYDAEWGT